jgi:Electron transfer DM13
MKRPTLLNAVICTAVVAIASSTVLKAVQADTMMKPEMSMKKMDKMEKTIASGSFVASEHPTTGMAKVVVMDGKQYLKFDRTFKSDSGPDLYVLLHREAMPKNYKKDDYINLGRLQKVAGSQMYMIPADVDVAKFKTAVIWCRQFNATFGFAALN